MDTVKALVLFSGGLDSMLAVRVLQEQGIETRVLCFKSNFYNCDKARFAAKQLNVELTEYDLTAEMAKLVKDPPSGYGKNLNPCIDCHSLMLRTAGDLARRERFDIIATGEVLGQRPFSQNKSALARVAALSGVDVLRPLSAKLLPPTDAEKEGLVKRSLLLDIKGRGRERQFELVAKYAISEYASPSGGCILTDPDFSARLGKMLEFWPDCSGNDIELLKYGRINWLKGLRGRHVLLVTGRHKEDNGQLSKLAKKGDIMVELKEMNGPTSVLRGLDPARAGSLGVMSLEIPENLEKSGLEMDGSKDNSAIIELAALLTGYYATKARGKKIDLNIKEAV